MAATLDTIFSAITALNQTASQLVTILGNSSSVFNMNLAALTTAVGNLPHTIGGSSAAPASPGTISFSSSLATSFILMQTSSGVTAKVAAYSNP
jgi:hypothetical protein